MLNGDGHSGLTVKGNPSREHLKHGDTEGIDITLLIGVASACLLR